MNRAFANFFSGCNALFLFLFLVGSVAGFYHLATTPGAIDTAGGWFRIGAIWLVICFFFGMWLLFIAMYDELRLLRQTTEQLLEKHTITTDIIEPTL
ncbi:hypothetical protein FE810_15460 [Thalassotalea litorea]|uniref:Uncharacterized protein n=1 Tax=Thalassotalea litorea TaxID=2020715 RepID=A0A5R9IGF5_9GAMM|nr:hypothetical protein [Thalassotalea litorea]TLU61218.1 hypothetical protein FE810_15460 [Thalassotalea litorea]